MEYEHDQGGQNEQGEGNLTDELLGREAAEGKGPLRHPGWREVGAAGSGVDTASRLDTDTAQVLGNA